MDVCISLFLCAELFFFFKQKTAYEMRISDGSSDVCSSDLAGPKIVVGRCGSCGLEQWTMFEAWSIAVPLGSGPLGAGAGCRAEDMRRGGGLAMWGYAMITIAGLYRGSCRRRLPP